MKGSIGINIGMANFWNPTGLLYADAIRTAQSGQGFLANPPISGQDVIIFDGLSAAAGAGVYQFAATGKCTLGVGASQSGVTASATSYDAPSNTSKATLTVSPANWPATSQVAIRVTWAPTDAPPTNVQLWRPNSTPGDLFWKPFLPLLAPFSTIRFMDTLATNGSTLADWSKRPVPTQRNYGAGIAWEDAIALCAQTKKDGWLNVPYMVATSDGGLAAAANTLAGLCPVGTAQHIYVEISNEIWNSAFPQWQQNQTAAAANPAVTYDGANVQVAGWRQPAYLTMLLTQAIEKAYGVPWRQTPIRPVLGWQWGDPRIATEQLNFIGKRFGCPAQFFYMGSEAPYATVDWSKNPQTGADLDADLLTGNPNSPTSQQHAALANQYSMKLGAYEFGKDFGQNPANEAIRDQAQSLPAAGPTELAALSAWGQVGGGLLCYYQLAYQDQNSGDWGLVQDPMNPNTLRYQAVAQAAQLMWWDDTPLPLPVVQPSPTPAAVQMPPLFSGSFKGKDGTGYNVSVTAG